MSHHPSDHAASGEKHKASGAINAYMVKGLTRKGIEVFDQLERKTTFHRQEAEQYIVDRTGDGAKEQFKLIHPGSTNIRARFIKAIA
ncbi:hypothetical protein [Delftia phage PhiW-14]|uniref:Uncharacterized protein n=1 Tax=Delftia phage PhiW-14 TaxID=665032 RepID=C9DG98_BPW14|nr:hypothetical protein DP-phiW-14_gp128 [Delftia phage PhiW-14]ACV50149.1 hypothetical protein [Delftia phage PhiW-14]